MKRLISSEKNKVHWLPEGTVVETYISDEMPPLEFCPSAYALVFKNGELLQTDLRKGERPERMLDIPGGHVDEGEAPDVCVIRETFEETGVHITEPRLVAYKSITVTVPKPLDWNYPYPTGYMLYYICKISEETPFDGNDDTHGRVWLSKDKYDESQWYLEEKTLVDEIIKEFNIIT